MTDPLFQPFLMGDLLLPNRIVMAPMSRSRVDPETHEPLALVADYYAQRASAGLIISEGLLIDPAAHLSIRLPGIYTQGQIRGWRAVTDRVHAAGGRMFAQILHAGRLSHPSVIGGAQPIAPSAIAPGHMVFTDTGLLPAPEPRAMTLANIGRTVANFGLAAENAIAAGFDGVEVHAANGYLIHQFLTPSANQRRDDYGGGADRRARFLFEVLNAVVARIGGARTGLRISPNVHLYAGLLQEAGLQSDYATIVRRLNDYDLAYLNICGHVVGEPDGKEAETLATAWRFRSLFDGPLILNYALSRDGASAALREGIADLASFGEPFVANPDLVARLRDDLPLATSDSATHFQGGASGYTDYPLALRTPETAS